MRYIIIRGHIRACVLAIDLGVVTRRGFCTLCLILFQYTYKVAVKFNLVKEPLWIIWGGKEEREIIVIL